MSKMTVYIDGVAYKTSGRVTVAVTDSEEEERLVTISDDSMPSRSHHGMRLQFQKMNMEAINHDVDSRYINMRVGS
jgi:hypothetical protein